jgi:hypothetical protein
MRKEFVMKKTLLVVLTLAVLLTAGTALAFNIPGAGGGSKLKKESKDYKLTDLSADLKSYEGGDLDPVKAKKFTATTFGDAEYDKVAVALTKMDLSIAFADNVLKDFNAKLDRTTSPTDFDMLKKNLETAKKAVDALVADSTKLVSAAQALATSLPSKAQSDPLGYGANIKEMTDVVKKLPDMAKKLPEIAKSLADAVTKAVEKAKAMAPK